MIRGGCLFQSVQKETDFHMAARTTVEGRLELRVTGFSEAIFFAPGDGFEMEITSMDQNGPLLLALYRTMEEKP